MALGSRKKKRPGGRNVSPPLASSPLLTRNLQLLPVGLTQLPNDEAFVAQLRQDIDELLSTFAEALLIKLLKPSLRASQSSEAGPSSQTIDSESTAQHVVSPISVFAQVWRQKGWHYVQFAFADHNDSKRAISDAICRVLLEHLEPYVKQHSDDRAQQTNQRPGSLAFASLGSLFKVMAVPFALYIFWSTQIYPTSGIGIKHCRPAMGRIPIEQDYYDVLLDLPEAMLKHLKEEIRTAMIADAISADLLEVLCRLAGTPFDAASISGSPLPQAQPSGKSKDDASAGFSTSKHENEPVFDIIPASSLATRMPRNWPSVRVMSSLEANKEFGRIGTVVRISPAGAHSLSVNVAGGPSTVESREAVAGLSRGDVLRLKARQRLAVANSTFAKLLDQQNATDPTSTQVEATGVLAQTAITDPQPEPRARAARYEIETPRWISSAKYTSKLQPWLEPVPIQKNEERASFGSKKRYRESRDRIMQAEGTADIDYGGWILKGFREKRRAVQSQQQPSDAAGAAGDAAAGAAGDAAAADEADPARNVTDVNDVRTLSLDSLYRLAAERTKTAAVERGEMLKVARAESARSK